MKGCPMKKLLLIVAAVLALVAIGLVVAVRTLLDAERIRATVVSEASAALGMPVTLASADVSIWPRAGLTLTDLVAGQPPMITLHSVRVTTALGALLSRRIEDAEVTVSGSHVDVLALLHVAERLSAPPPVAADTAGAAPAITLVNVKEISFRDVVISAAGKTATVSLESSLTGDRLDVGSLVVATPMTTLKASGAIESLAARRAKLSMTADPLDLDGMMAMLAETTNSAGSTGAMEGMDLTLDLKAAKGRAAGVAFTDLDTIVRVTGNHIALEPLSLGLFGGRIDGLATIDISGREPALVVKGRLGNVDMAAVSVFAGQPGSVTGKLGGTIALSGTGTDPAAAIAKATGSGALAITGGSMPNLHLVRAIVLAFGKPAAVQPAGADAFSRLSANMQLANNVIRLTDIDFQSRDVDLKGGGTLALAGSRLNVKAAAMLSEELTAQAGRDLIRYAADEGQVTVPVLVTGTVSHPAIRIDVADLLRRAATNEIKGQLKKQTDSLLDRLIGKKKKP